MRDALETWKASDGRVTDEPQEVQYVYVFTYDNKSHKKLKALQRRLDVLYV